MPRIFAPHDEHNFNAGGVQFVNGAAALAKDHASLPFFDAKKGYDVDNSKHSLTALDTLPRATLDAIAAYMGITLVPADGKYEVIRDIEGAISTLKLGTLTVASVAHASKVGFTVITVTEALTGTNVHKYKTHATEAPAPLYGDEADASWLPLTSGATGGIELTTGHKITVVECTTAVNQISAEVSSFESSGQALAGNLSRLVSFINSARPELGINTGPAVAALNVFINVYNAIARVLGLKTIGGAGAVKTGGGGGGGGKSAFAKDLDAIAHDVAMGRIQLEGELKRLEALESKYRDRRGRSTLKADEREDLDERLYQKREELRKQNLQADYEAMEHKKALDQLTIQQEISALERIQQAHKLNAEEQRELAEQLHDARNRLRERELNWALALVDHQTAMSELNAAAQIQALERIKTAHKLTQEEMWRLDERIHSLRQQQSQDQVSQVRAVYDQITAAMRKRYETEKQLETKALDDRIKHLNDLTAAENRQARQDDHEANLAEKQRLLSVTKSARQRRELQAEIDKMIADEELRRRQEERQAEINRLNEQKQAINDKYQQLMDEENLRQEALRMVMSGNLKQMSDLIASYGSKWKDAGEQLAQALTDGLTGNSSGIMRQINAILEGQQTAINRYLQQMGGMPNLTGTSGITLNLYGLTVRKEADVEQVAGVIFDKIRAAGR